ncbi:alpha/beta fold hydrolase [Candidimonas nitroreducens]|uniref:Alpha/beta hydrolase n=1 Tax=Candidimonas nitroreducens TaxID=683354 RepID=A0A225M0T1_9BURK|nr:alpha/beta hydrolase [Candidimonas nitroreducens]OWT54786.1 alpha/beta hydrolase [Candidimonas nitroreducens]
MSPQLVALATVPGGYMESQSGLQRANPKVYGNYMPAADGSLDLAFIVFHPTSNFHGHYLLGPLAKHNAGLLALNTRYVGNDSVLLMEMALHDVAAGMRFLRDRGYRKIVMLGNSGGGSLAALYQQQAELPSIRTTPDGRLCDIAAAALPAADALALVAAHPGRATQLLAKIDPSVLDESDAARIDPQWDLFAEGRTAPLDREWVREFRLAQERRLKRIVAWVECRLQELDRSVPPEIADDAFIVRRTQADPRTVDLTLDASDRGLGGLGGDARLYNAAANGLARFCTLRSFLSQWSPWHTRALGPECLSKTRAPVLIVEYSADQTVFPSQIREWCTAAGSRGQLVQIKGAPHYLTQGPDIERVAQLLDSWARGL